MGRFLYGLKKEADYAIISLEGGKKDNAITRECTAEFLTDAAEKVKAAKVVKAAKPAKKTEKAAAKKTKKVKKEGKTVVPAAAAAPETNA